MRKKASFFKGMRLASLVWVMALAGVLFGACDSGGGDEDTTYTVSFSIGEGSGSAPTSQNVKAGASVTLPGQGAMTAPDGKTFAGWKTGNSTYEAGASVAINADTVFTAQWGNKTYVLFRNTEKFAVSIYKESTYLTEIALVPAEGTEQVEFDAAPSGITFYPRFQFTVDGLPVFTQDDPGIAARVDANKVNEVTVPRLSEVTVEKACVRIENESGASLTFNRDGYELPPVGTDSTILPPQEQGLYVVDAGGISGYVVMRNTTEAVALSQSVSEFERGMVYTFHYNGTALVLTDVADMWGNLTFFVSTASEMQTALASIGGSTDASARFVIAIEESFSLEPTSISGVSFTIMGGDEEEKTISLDGMGSLFTVESGATLTLGNNVILQGASDNTAPLVMVNSGGSLEMNSGAKLINNSNSSSSSGGVYVAEDGTFTMNGGVISGNSSINNAGGGVVIYGGTFTMTGGTVSSNTAGRSGGGVYVGSGGTFTMTDGEISGNIARHTGGYGGGGVNVDGDGTSFTMSGGLIRGNTATYYGGGVGVFTGGTFTMTGGEISGNKASVNGGGVGVYGTFTMSGGAISNNAATSYGGGVYVYDYSKWTFTKQTGGVIYGFEADTSLRNLAYSDSYGHAVYASSKKRSSTAGTEVTLDSTVSGADGGWED